MHPRPWGLYLPPLSPGHSTTAAPTPGTTTAIAKLGGLLSPLSKADRYSAAMLALKHVQRTAGGGPLVRGAAADAVAAREPPVAQEPVTTVRGAGAAAAQKRKREAAVGEAWEAACGGWPP